MCRITSKSMHFQILSILTMSKKEKKAYKYWLKTVRKKTPWNIVLSYRMWYCEYCRTWMHVNLRWFVWFHNFHGPMWLSKANNIWHYNMVKMQCPPKVKKYVFFQNEYCFWKWVCPVTWLCKWHLPWSIFNLAR